MMFTVLAKCNRCKYKEEKTVNSEEATELLGSRCKICKKGVISVTKTND